MKKRITYILGLIISFIVGCETDADVKVPEFEQKLVVAGFLSPSDSVSYINVSSNKPVYGLIDTEQPVGILTGYLSDGNIEIQLENTFYGFKLDHRIMHIEYGKTYFLRIVSDQGLHAEAVCTVPEKRNFTIQADTFSISYKGSPSQGYRQISLKVSVNDIPGEENYYSLGIKGFAKQSIPNPFNPREYSIHLSGAYFIRSDKNIDGQKIRWDNTNAYLDYFYRAERASLVVYLYHTEKAYYLYHKSLNTNNDGDNPFSEAAPVYSNIKGGLGIFSAYTVDSIVYILK